LLYYQRQSVVTVLQEAESQEVPEGSGRPSSCGRPARCFRNPWRPGWSRLGVSPPRWR